jgi:integrase
MGRKTFAILFFIKKSKLLRNQEAPIYLRITVDGKRAEVSIKRSICPVHWNEMRGEAESTLDYAGELNQYLNQIRHQIYQHQLDLRDKRKAVTALSLKNAFLNIDNEDDMTILQAYQEHNENLKRRINKGVSKSTFIRHTTSKIHLERFIKEEYKQNDYYLKDIDHLFIVKYENYLRVKRDCNNNTTVKYIRNMGKIIREAMNRNIVMVNPFRNIKLKIEEVDIPFLNKNELLAITEKKITLARISLARDIFVFCCFTGLAFVDVKSLTRHDLEEGPDGTIWIKKQRHKSKIWAHVPLLPPAKQILDKYKLNPVCQLQGVLLPVTSNQKMNAYLKEIAELCGITKNLTTHCARHTFATTVALANGISIESTSKMLGHSNIRMTQKYARILDSTIGQEMNQLAGKLNFQLN